MIIILIVIIIIIIIITNQSRITNPITTPKSLHSEQQHNSFIFLYIRLVDNVMERSVPIIKQILLQEAAIEESLHLAVEGHKEAFGDFRR